MPQPGQHDTLPHPRGAGDSGPSARTALYALLALAASMSALFVAREYVTAGQIGFPSDTGWSDIVAGRAALTGFTDAGTPTVGPGYAAIMGLLDWIAGRDPFATAAAAKTIGLCALALTCWSLHRTVLHLVGATSLALPALALFAGLSSALVWSGASGLAVAPGIALVSVGILNHVVGRTLRGTAWTALATWFTPAAIPILLVGFAVDRTELPRRALIGAALMACWIAWHTANGTLAPQVPSPAEWWAWIQNWLALIGLTWRGAVHPPVIAFLAVAGTFALGRRGRYLVLAAVAPAVLTSIVEPGPGGLGRLLFPAMPAALILAVIGLDAIARRQSSGPLRGRRLAYVLLAMHVAWTVPQVRGVGTLYAWQVENTVQAGSAGRWLAVHARPGEAIATTAPGAVGYHTGRPVVDLNAIDRVSEYLLAHRPAWVAINVGVSVPEILVSDYETVNSVAFRRQAGVYPAGPLVTFRRTYREGIAFGRAPAYRLPRPSSMSAIRPIFMETDRIEPPAARSPSCTPRERASL